MTSPSQCAICRDLNPSLRPGQKESVRWCLIKQIWEKAAQGCAHCQLLRKSLEAIEDDNGKAAVEESGTYTSQDFRIICGEPNPRQFANSTTQPVQQGSDVDIATATDWVDECRKNHALCGSGQPNPLPTRILDLGQDDTKVLLVEPDEKSARYCCQSYCWGLSRTVITTEKTLQQHKDGIKIDDLPRTFRDTIAFTKRLGLRYLWIDSLCIIQDSEPDWRQEAAKMGGYYGGAYLTIAATMSTSADDGLFQRHISATLSDESQPWKVYAHRHLGQAKSALFTRGWIFQERLLSLRVLHFAASELCFECNVHSTCQCGQTINDQNWQAKQEYLSGMKVSETVAKTFPVDTWHRIVEAYRSLNLTNPTDIMPALSGLAGQMAEQRPGDVYIAGLWRSTLLNDMLWTISGLHQPPERRFVTPWCAPTWSWASISVPTRYGGYPNLDVHFTKVIEANCEWIPPSTAGEIASAHVVLEGPVISGSVKRGSTLYESQDSIRIVHGRFFPDWQIPEELVEVNILRIGQVSHGMGDEYWLVLKKVKSFNTGTEDGDLYERVGLHKFPPKYNPWNQVNWKDVEILRVKIV